MAKPQRTTEAAEFPEQLNPLDPRDCKRVQQRLGRMNIRDALPDTWEHRVMLLSQSQRAIVWAKETMVGQWAVLARSTTTFEPLGTAVFEPTYRILLRRPKIAVPASGEP